MGAFFFFSFFYMYSMLFIYSLLLNWFCFFLLRYGKKRNRGIDCVFDFGFLLLSFGNGLVGLYVYSIVLLLKMMFVH